MKRIIIILILILMTALTGGAQNVKKARKGIEMTLDYLEKLVNDILEKYPAGVLPPTELMTQRNPEDIQAVIDGKRHIYTLSYE